MTHSEATQKRIERNFDQLDESIGYEYAELVTGELRFKNRESGDISKFDAIEKLKSVDVSSAVVEYIEVDHGGFKDKELFTSEVGRQRAINEIIEYIKADKADKFFEVDKGSVTQYVIDLGRGTEYKVNREAV